MSRKVEKILIAGRDAAAWLTALACARALGRTGVKVEVLELPSLLSPVDFYATLPTQQGLHRLLGITEDDVLRECSASLSLGQRFANWSRGNSAFMHPYDSVGVEFNNIAFSHYWVKARSKGLDVAFEDFSLGAVAAKQGRIVLNRESTRNFTKASHGYHVDAGAYVRMIKKRAMRMGVRFTATQIEDVAVEDNRITAITGADGKTFTADMFVDATGAEAALLSRLEDKANFASWDDWFLCDRMMVASGKPLTPIPAFAQVMAMVPGWVSIHPLTDRTPMVAVYNSDYGANDDEMLQTIVSLTGIQLSDDAVASSLRQGARQRPWIGNCCAIGEASITLEPLDAIPLHAIHTGLSRLITLMPVDADRIVEADRYNDYMAAYTQNVRDFQLAHYKLNKRFDETLWDRCREMAVPDSLAYKIDLFSQTGTVALYEDETFEVENWASVFIGHGLVPESYHPFVDKQPDPELINQFQQMLKFIAVEVSEMPSLMSQLEIQSPQASSARF